MAIFLGSDCVDNPEKLIESFMHFIKKCIKNKEEIAVYVIAYDIGTTGVKTCLFEVGDTLRLLAGEYEGYGLYILPGGGAEQDADEWWAAMGQKHPTPSGKDRHRP